MKKYNTQANRSIEQDKGSSYTKEPSTELLDGSKIFLTQDRRVPQINYQSSNKSREFKRNYTPENMKYKTKRMNKLGGIVGNVGTSIIAHTYAQIPEEEGEAGTQYFNTRKFSNGLSSSPRRPHKADYDEMQSGRVIPPTQEAEYPTRRQNVTHILPK